jgi:ACS family glucarate transporter-like MFS transporter
VAWCAVTRDEARLLAVEPAAVRPSRVRLRVLALAFALTVVTYLDRVCISAAAPVIMRDLHLSLLQMSAVFSAFTLAYSIFEIPSGWLGDVRGPRRVLTRIVLWWSAFTMLTGLARGFQSLVTIRFLFGVGEAGAFPNIIRSFAHWFPLRERGRASGVMFLGSRVGGMLSAPIALLLIARAGWRMSFTVFGVIGLVWAVVWARWYRDRPADHPAVDAAELAWIEQDAGAAVEGETTPWRALLASRNLWAICAMYFAYGYGLYFYLTWLPTYLISELKFSALGGGFFASLPFLLAGLANVGGGWATDRLAAHFGLRVARSGLGCCSFVMTAALLFASTAADPAVVKALLLAAALGAADFSLSACWAAPLDVAAGHAGVMTGFMNTFGNLGGLLCPFVVGWAVQQRHSWTLPFHITAITYVAGAVAWLMVDPTHRIVGASSPLAVRRSRPA